MTGTHDSYVYGPCVRAGPVYVCAHDAIAVNAMGGARGGGQGASAPLCPNPCLLVAPGEMLVVLKCPKVTIHLSKCDDNNLQIIIMETSSTLRCRNA